MAAQNEPAVRRKGAILAAAVFDFPFEKRGSREICLLIFAAPCRKQLPVAPFQKRGKS
jgi:hypothetical protein